MFQALGLVAAGFLLHWLLNRPMDAAPPTTDADPATIPDNDTPQTLEAYSDPPYSVIEFAPETSVMAQYVVAKDGYVITGPNGKTAYSYKTLAEAIERVNALKEADSDPMGPVAPDPEDTPEPAPGDLPGMPGSGGGFGGGGYGGLGGDSSALPVFGGNIGGVGANDAQYGLQW